MIATQLTWGTSGNISARTGAAAFLISATGVRLGEMTADGHRRLRDLGGSLGGRAAGRRSRPGCIAPSMPSAPTWARCCTARRSTRRWWPLGVAGHPYATTDSVYYVGEVGRVGFELPGTAELADAVAAAIPTLDVLLLQNHGCGGRPDARRGDQPSRGGRGAVPYAGRRSAGVSAAAAGARRCGAAARARVRLREPDRGDAMADIVSLEEAVAELVRDGDAVALEGFTHLIPFAAGHEMIRQGRRDLTLIRMTPDLIYDQLIGAGCAPSWSSRGAATPASARCTACATRSSTAGPGRSSSRSTATPAWPPPTRRARPTCRSPCCAATPAPTCPAHTAAIWIDCPFTGEQLAAVPALRPDVGIIHAQRADRDGQRAALGDHRRAEGGGAGVAARSLVTVEEIVDELEPRARRGRAALLGGDRGGRSPPAAPTRRTRTATTTATTPSTAAGTRSAATATRFRDWIDASTCWRLRRYERATPPTR